MYKFRSLGVSNLIILGDPGHLTNILICNINVFLFNDIFLILNLIYDDPTGIDDAKVLLSDIQIYPNPNEGKFKLVYNGERDIDLKLQLINLQGQVILSEQIEAGNRFSKEFELEYLSAGIYYFRLMNREGVVVKKMVVR